MLQTSRGTPVALRNVMVHGRLIAGCAFLSLASACVVGDPTEPGAGETGDDGSDGDGGIEIDDFAVNPHNLNIGFNNGYAEQFDYFADFFGATAPTLPRLCHAYVSWDVATKAPHSGVVT